MGLMDPSTCNTCKIPCGPYFRLCECRRLHRMVPNISNKIRGHSPWASCKSCGRSRCSFRFLARIWGTFSSTSTPRQDIHQDTLAPSCPSSLCVVSYCLLFAINAKDLDLEQKAPVRRNSPGRKACGVRERQEMRVRRREHEHHASQPHARR